MSSSPSASKWLLIVAINVIVTVITAAAFVQVFNQDPGRPQPAAAVAAAVPVETAAPSAPSAPSAPGAPQQPAVAAQIDAPTLTPTSADAPANGDTAPALAPAPVTNAKVHVSISAVKSPGQRMLEAVVIANEGDQVELTGWTLVAPGGATYVFPSYVLLPNNFVQIYTADGANAPTSLFWNQPEAVWKSGDVVTLKNGDQVAATYTVR